MSEVKYTPGPWLIFPKVNKMLVYCDDEMGSLVADCSAKYTTISKEERHANAKLIACAPELLEALTGKEQDPHIYAVNWLATLLRVCRKEEVYKAICKDQGEDFDSVNTMLIELNMLVKNGNEAIKKATE